MSVPADVASLLDDFTAADRRAQAVAGDLSDEQVNWRPSETAWSIGQCLDHLAAGNRVYMDAVEPAVVRARTENRRQRGPIAPNVFERWFIAELEPPPKRRLPAPKKIVPAARFGRAEVLAAFLASQERVRAVLGRAADLDLVGTRFTNPFLKLWRMRAGSAFLVLAAHTRRHLLQAERVRGNELFPAG